MKVKDLIKELQSMPKNLEVHWADHDHGTYHTNAIARQCILIDKTQMNKIDNDDDFDNSGHEMGTYKNTPKKYVVIRS